MTTHELHALDGTSPTGWLAALGLVRACPSSTRLSFTDATPVLHTDLQAPEVAAAAAEVLAQASRPENLPIPKSVHTTVPTTPVMAELARRTWDEPAMDQATAFFDYGTIKEGTTGPQVGAGSLILISGTSHLRQSLKNLWPSPSGRKAPPLERVRAQQTQQLRADLTEILTGGYPRAAATGNALRYTAAEITPRLRSGTESTITTPAVEILAFHGATALLAHQLGVPSTGRERAGLTWALNPVPLTPAALVAIHEQQAVPASWTRCTTVKTPLDKKATASYFGDTRILEEGA